MEVAPIVVGTDGSPTARRAVARAGELARALGTSVHVVSVSVSSAHAVGVAVAGAFAPIVTDDDYNHAAARGIVDAACSDLREGGVLAEAHVYAGDPADGLISVAETTGAQMIVVGNRGMTGARRLLGSVPNDVSHRARCAVLIIPTAEA